MHKIMEYLCKEMEDLEKKIEKNGGLNPSETQYLDTLAHTKKNLLKAEEMSEESEQSYRGSYRGSYADGRGSYRGSYEGGSMRGSYAEPMYADDERTDASRYSTRRDRMGRYSREDGYSRADASELADELRGMMSDLPPHKQKELDKIIKRYER
jgi:hypothetical protein